MPHKHFKQIIRPWLTRIRPNRSTLRVALLVCVAAMVLGALAYTALNPALRLKRSREAMLDVRGQVRQLRPEEERLEKRIEWLKSPEGVTAQARERGMVGPGEEAVRFPPQKPADGQPASATTEPESPSTSVAVMAVLMLFLLAFLTGIGLLLYRRRALRAKRPVGMLTPRSELRRRRRRAEPARER